MKVAFLDRDGTIIKDYPDSEWSKIKTPEFLVGTIEALKFIINKNFKIIIVTNQYLIGEKIISLQEYNKFTKKFLDTLNESNINILDIFYCPHSRKKNCNCMKPKDGLILQAINKYPNIDLKESFFVGDSICDMELCKNCNIKFYGINISCKNKIGSLMDIINLL